MNPCWLFERVNKTDKPLTKSTKEKKQKIHINKVKNKKGKITIITTELQ